MQLQNDITDAARKKFKNANPKKSTQTMGTLLSKSLA